MLERVNAHCTVDDLGGMQYGVNVEGLAPFDCRRVYTLKATSEDKAAQEGLRLFVEEMHYMRDSGQGYLGGT